MSIDPADFYIRGVKDVVRPTPAIASGDLLSARLLVRAGTQLVVGSGYVIWDATPVWDRIGVTGDFGSVYLPDGEYHLDAFVNGSPATVSGGTAVLLLLTGGSGDPDDNVDEESGAPQSTDTGPKLSVGSVHRFYGGGSFQVELRLFGGGDITITQASLSITRQASVPPL